MKVKYKLTQIKPNIFCIEIKDIFDLSMLFCRYQEYYESANRRYKGKQFTFIDFMRSYSKEYGKGTFSYTDDFVGFNLPGDIITEVLFNIKDLNEYDALMSEIYQRCFKARKNIKEGKFYLIGFTGKDKWAIKHELSHALFFTNKTYKKEMLDILKQLPISKYKRFSTILKDLNYSKSVHDDEMIAYCSTGLIKEMKVLKISPNLLKIFRKKFKEYE